MSRPEARIRSWITGKKAEIRTGLIGYLSVEYGNLVLDGITLRRTRDGRFTLSFPARRDSSGRQHPYIRPLDDDARRDLERQVFARLGIDQEVAP